MNVLLQRGIALLSFLLLLLFFPFVNHAATVERQVEKPLRSAVDTGQKSQKEMDAWQNQRAELNARYDALTEETAGLESYEKNLLLTVEAGRKRLAAKEEQLAETEKISEGIAPFLEELLSRLREVSSDGPPFLAKERAARLVKMEEMMVDPEVSIGEKYRRLMEALQIEAEYGFTTEVYQQEIETDAGLLLVDIFRLGRLNLFYISLDGQGCGFYNEAAGTWQPLADTWLRPITAAIAMVRKEQPVDFVDLPLGEIDVRSAAMTGEAADVQQGPKVN